MHSLEDTLTPPLTADSCEEDCSVVAPDVDDGSPNEDVTRPTSPEDGDSGIKSMETSFDRAGDTSTSMKELVTQSRPKKKTRRRKRVKTPI